MIDKQGQFQRSRKYISLPGLALCGKVCSMLTEIHYNTKPNLGELIALSSERKKPLAPKLLAGSNVQK